MINLSEKSNSKKTESLNTNEYLKVYIVFIRLKTDEVLMYMNVGKISSITNLEHNNNFITMFIYDSSVLLEILKYRR